MLHYPGGIQGALPLRYPLMKYCAGVPKFFRWLAERYPLVLQKVSAEPVEIDHLYLDMNGIIHNCTHANNAAKATASEDEMIHLVFQYIERLVRIAKPKKLLYMAIDGAPPSLPVCPAQRRPLDLPPWRLFPR